MVEALLPSGSGVEGESKPTTKDEKGSKEWIENELKALSLPPGRLGVKAAEALFGIIAVILSCILNKPSDVVGWVSQNLWELVVATGGLL